MAKSKKADLVVTMDRRRNDRRGKGEAPAAPVAARKLERREKVNRRRQIDPTTCERDYSGDEIEFMNALEVYKRNNGRMFPTCSEILEVIRALGYQKIGQVNVVVSPAQSLVEGQANITDSDDVDLS